MPNDAPPPRDVSLRDLVMEDIRRGKLAQSYRRDLRDIYRFYFSEEERERLAGMKPVKRFFRVFGWLLRNLLLRLSPNRRLLLVFAALLVVLGDVSWHSDHVSIDLAFGRFSFVPVLIVLMLELKDKLLARDEIEVARKVQMSLLPKDHPALAGWEIWSATTPANDVGGDLIDYLDGASGRLGLALGDVAGKGMGAALLCAKLQATLRALAPHATDLRALGSDLNGVLERSGLDSRYATLFYCEIAAGASPVRYLNAGHNPGLIVRGAAIDVLAASAPPLGMLPGTRYEQGNVDLGSGDLIVLYSDGITEAADATGAEFGLDRLKDALLRSRDLSAERIARGILDAAARFLGGEKPHDDQSILVIRRVTA